MSIRKPWSPAAASLLLPILLVALWPTAADAQSPPAAAPPPPTAATSPALAPTPAAAPAHALRGKSPLELLREGGNTALVQLFLSVFGAGFAIERFLFLRRRYIAPRGLAAEARRLWREGGFAELATLAERRPSTLARAISFIVAHRHSPVAEVSLMAGDIVSRELSVQHQKAYPLGVVATLEPLLGLLGMILGMIESFEMVALAGALGDPTQLASGISEALVTTGLGLAIAIPFLALHHLFKARTNAYGALLEQEITDLLSEWLMRKEEDHAR